MCVCVCVCVCMCTCTFVNIFNIFTATLHIWRLLSVMTRVPLSLMRHGNEVQRLFDLISLHNLKVYQHLASCSVLHTENYVFLSCNYIQILILGTCNLSITYHIYFQMTKSMIFLYAMIRQMQNLLLEF